VSSLHLKIEENSMKRVSIALVGCGTVGSGVVEVLAKERENIAKQDGVKIELRKIFTRTPDGQKSSTVFKKHPTLFVHDSEDILDDPEIEIVLETVGGKDFAREVVTRAIEKKKHVVTANKLLLAYFGKEIFDSAQKQGVRIGYEASVAGAIPIIRVIRSSLVGSQICAITGILNGTSNFILTEMAVKSSSFKESLKAAQKLGYAEADPTEDISGEDARNKLVVLSRLAFGFDYNPDDIYTQGIEEVIPEDFEYAQRKLGSTIRLVGHASRGGAVYVAPMIIPKDNFLATIPGNQNGITVSGANFERLGFTGPGAGALPTASAIVADVVNIAKHQGKNFVPAVNNSMSKAKPVRFEDLEFRHTLRFMVQDQLGVLRDISTILAKEGVSIHAVEQNEYSETKKEGLPFLITLSSVKEEKVQKALVQINKLPFMVKPVMVFRSFV